LCHMTRRPEMSWNLVKGDFRHLDRAGLVDLLKDLHTLAPENRAFLEHVHL
jgi:hypothetical protein